MLFFSTYLLRNCEMPVVEAAHANDIWYEDDAHVLYTDFIY